MILWLSYLHNEIPYSSKTKSILNQDPEGRLNIKMLSYQYRDSHVKEKTVSQPSYL